MPHCNPELGRPQPVRAHEATDTGSAVVEFIFLAVLLVIPVVYLILTVANLQAGAFAAAGAADQAARVFVASPSRGAGQAAAEQAMRIALADAGIDNNAGTLAITCQRPGCQSPGVAVSVEVRIRVPLPLVPGLPGINTSAAIVSAHSAALTGRYG